MPVHPIGGGGSGGGIETINGNDNVNQDIIGTGGTSVSSTGGATTIHSPPAGEGLPAKPVVTNISSDYQVPSPIPAVLYLSCDAEGVNVKLPVMNTDPPPLSLGQCFKIYNADAGAPSFNVCFQDGTLLYTLNAQESITLYVADTTTANGYFGWFGSNVESVNGKTDVVLLDTDDIPESSTNQFLKPVSSKTLLANLTNSAALPLSSTLSQIFNALTSVNKNWYVDQVLGNDSNTGTTPNNAFQSVKHAEAVASSGDIINFIGNYTESTLFIVSLSLTFVSSGNVTFSNGVSFPSSANTNTNWRDHFTFNSTNGPVLNFNNAGIHIFDDISYTATYDSSATPTIAPAILCNASGNCHIYIKSITSGSLITDFSDEDDIVVARCPHFYSTGIYSSSIVIENAYILLNRSQNGVAYNICYSDCSSVYTWISFNDIAIIESNAGQSDSTINDLFTGLNFNHSIIANDIFYQSQNFYLGGMIRLANCESGNNRACVLINGINIDPAYLPDGNISLSNATYSTDVCSVINATILKPFTMTVSGAGVNTYSYYDLAGNYYTSNAPNQTFNVVLGDAPITNNSITGSIQLNEISINAGEDTSFVFNNSFITEDTPLSFGNIFAGPPNVNIIVLGTNPVAGSVEIFIQNVGSANFTGPIAMDFIVRTNYHYA